MGMQEGMIAIKVIYDDGDQSHTRFNGSPEEAEEYYIGTPFNFGWFNGREVFKVCTAIEIITGA